MNKTQKQFQKARDTSYYSQQHNFKIEQVQINPILVSSQKSCLKESFNQCKKVNYNSYNVQKALKCKLNKGRWKFQEQKLYIRYIKVKKSQINHITNKRKQKLFQDMSAQIQTRTPKQCVSHHQKMMKTYLTIQGIIQSFQRKGSFETVNDVDQKFIEEKQIKKQNSQKNCSLEVQDKQLKEQMQYFKQNSQELEKVQKINLHQNFNYQAQEKLQQQPKIRQKNNENVSEWAWQQCFNLHK